MTTPKATLTLATLNIGAASKERARRLMDEWIVPRSADVFVLTETSDGPGTHLIVDELRRANWAIFQRPTNAKDRGVVVATRVAAKESDGYPANDPAPGRCVVLTLETQPAIQITGMYVPNRGNDAAKLDRKRSYMSLWLDSIAKAESGGLRVVVGDLNVVPPAQHPVFLPQQPFEYAWYDALITQCSLCDVPDSFPESSHEPTWVAYTGEGYTYDHVLVDAPLYERLTHFEYDHATRKSGGITDHSGLIATFSVDYANRRPTESFGAPVQTELF